MWNSDDVKPAPNSWDVMLDPKVAAKYKGKISDYDDPIYIADAAVYLKIHEPDLGIENPYELNEEQFEAAVDLLKEQRPNVGEYWSEAAKQISAFAGGDSQVGTTWQYQYFALKGEGEPVAASPASQGFLPKEGATGWSDTWMISSEAKHPNCMYMWMNWIIEPKVNAEVAEFFGEAPAQRLACERDREQELLHRIPRRRPGVLEARLLLGDAARRLRQRRRTTARTTTTGSRPGPRSRAESSGRESMATEAVVERRSAGRRLAGLFHGRPRLQVGALLAGPVGWLVDRLPGLARGPADRRLLDRRPAQRRGRSRASASKTSKRSSTNRSTATSSGARS